MDLEDHFQWQCLYYNEEHYRQSASLTAEKDFDNHNLTNQLKNLLINCN